VNKFFGGVLGLLSWLWIVISVVGMTLGMLAIKPERLGSFVQSWNYVFGGLVLLLLVMAYCTMRLRFARMRRRKEVRYANAIGEIAISLGAIEEALERLLDDRDIVRSHEVTIYDDPHNKKLNVRARLSMWETNDLPSKIADIQQELKRRFEEIMPDAESVDYKVKLSSIMPRAKKSTVTEQKVEETPASESENATDETDYFTGLKYPIESGDSEEED
jgi:hypothetical protein